MKNWKLIAATLIALIALFALSAAYAEATELTYTPGEDLVLVDDNDVKIWITADGWYDDWIEQEYKSFTPLDDYSFVLAVIDWENKSDEPRTITYNGKINGYSIIDSEYRIGLGDLPAHTTFSDERDDGFGNIIKQPNIQMSFYEDLAEYNNIDEATVKEALKGPEYVLELNLDIEKPLDESGNTSTVLYKTGPIIVHYNAENDSPSAKPEDVKPEADTLADTQADTLADTQGDAQADGPSVVYTDKATVKAVQQALNDAGYNCGKPDGAAGKKTKAAITQFQTDKGLEVTGQIDDALLEALGVELSDEIKAQHAAEAVKALYEGDAFLEKLNASFTERVMSEAPDPESDEVTAMLEKYRFHPFAGDDVPSSSLSTAEDTLLFYWYTDQGKKRGEPPIVFLETDTENNIFDYYEYLQWTEVVSLAGRVFGLKDEEVSELTAYLGSAPAWGETVSLESWDDDKVFNMNGILARFIKTNNAAGAVVLAMMREEDTSLWNQSSRANNGILM